VAKRYKDVQEASFNDKIIGGNVMGDKVVLVNIGNSPRDYAYLTDLDLQVGDVVSCPMGKDNQIKTATVRWTNPTPEEAQWATKKIIGRV